MTQSVGVKAEDQSTEGPEPVKDDLAIWGAEPRDFALDVIVDTTIFVHNLKRVNQTVDREEIRYAIDLMEAHVKFVASVNEFSQQEIDEHYTKIRDRFWFGNDDRDNVARSELATALGYGVVCKSELTSDLVLPETEEACL
jgi:hypothetical protein